MTTHQVNARHRHISAKLKSDQRVQEWKRDSLQKRVVWIVKSEKTATRAYSTPHIEAFLGI